MLGQPISMLIPEVVGFKVTGAMREGVTATALRWGVIALAIVGVLAAGQFKNTRNKDVTTG